jgi:hypothetical protein
MDAETVPNAVRTIVKDAEANLAREISDFVGPLWGKKYCVAVYTDSDDGLFLYWTYSRLCQAPKGVVQARCVLDHHPTATLRGPDALYAFMPRLSGYVCDFIAFYCELGPDTELPTRIDDLRFFVKEGDQEATLPGIRQHTWVEVAGLEAGEVAEVEQRDKLFDWVQALVANQPGEG